MKKFKELLLIAVLPAVVVVLCYVGYDYWVFRQKALNPPPILKASVFRMPVVGPIIPHDKLPRRKFVEINGEEVNEKEFTRVLVLDLNGDGISLCGLNGLKKCSQWPKNSFFDFNHDGFKENAPYFGEDDALLVYHAEKNSENPEDGRNIVGNYFHDNKDRAKGAFDILRHLTGKKEVVNRGDEVLNKLFVWQYGLSKNPLALRRLSDLGAKINLDVVSNQEILPSGNILGDYVEVELEDGSKRKLQEVWLYTNRGFLSRSNLSESEKTRDIPNVSGLGTILPLWDAIVQDKSGKLENLVRKYLNEPNFFVREALLREIVYQWAGVADVDPLSRISEDGINHIGDARKVAVVEKIVGRPFIGTHSGNEDTPNPHYQSVPYVWAAFENFVRNIRSQLDTLGVAKQIFITAVSDNPEILKDEIIKFQNKYGLLQTKLQLNTMCRYVRPEFKKAGKVSLDINLAKCEEFIIKGTEREDILKGKEGKDNIFFGSYRNDMLNGGSGDDVYIYGLHDGGDIILETGGYDRIMFLGDITPEMVSFEKSGSDLIIKVGSNGGGIIIHEFGKEESKQVEELVFAGGKKVYLSEIYAKLLQTETPLFLNAEFLEEKGRNAKIKND